VADGVPLPPRDERALDRGEHLEELDYKQVVMDEERPARGGTPSEVALVEANDPARDSEQRRFAGAAVGGYLG
jgi:hypothetical protein